MILYLIISILSNLDILLEWKQNLRDMMCYRERARGELSACPGLEQIALIMVN